MWHLWKKRWTDPGKFARDVAVTVVFLLGTGAAGTGIYTHDLGLIAASLTLYGLIAVGKS